MTREETDLIEARLINWALFLRHGGIPALSYVTWPQIMKQYWDGTDDRATCSDEIDAMYLADIISTLDVAGRDGIGLGSLYAFILKIEYIEIGRPVGERAKHVSRKFSRPCGERTYYYHLASAKTAVHSFAEPIK